VTENEINLAVREWLLQEGYSYKGVCNAEPGLGLKQKDVGYGQVPIPLPSGERLVLIDHQGVKDRPVDLIWVEAKGSDAGVSQLLEGFIRTTCACYFGAGRGLLAVPTAECEKMLELQDFLKRVAVSCERRMGILDAEKGKVYWLL